MHIETNKNGSRLHGYKAKGQLGLGIAKLNGEISRFSAGYESFYNHNK